MNRHPTIEREVHKRFANNGEMANPDFAAYARTFGAYGEVVESSAGAAAAFERAVRSGGPALLEPQADRNALAPGLALDDLRSARR